MTATVTERPGSKAETKFVRMSASKARVVLNLIRGKKIQEAKEILFLSDRLAAEPVKKCLDSAVANAAHNEDISEDDLFISACYADEGPTIKRFRPRARGRASRIHKQICHIVIEVERYTDEELKEMRDSAAAKAKSSEGKAKKKKTASRADRVAKSKAKDTAEETSETPPTPDEAEANEAEETEAVETEEVEAETTSEEEAETPQTPDEVEAVVEPEAEAAEETDETDNEEDEKEGEA